MNRLLILGAGQYGTVAKEVAEAMGCYKTISFLDDKNPNAVGKLEEYASLSPKYPYAFVAIGDLSLRGEWVRRLRDAGFFLPVLVHPRAVVMPSAEVGAASIIEAMAVVSSNAVMGEGCIVSAGAVVNHNAAVGNWCHIDCNAVVPANASVPDQTKVCCGTVYCNQEVK